MPPSETHRFRRAIALIIAASAAMPCAAQEPYAQRVADAVPKVEHAVGLSFKTPPRFEVRSREELARALDATYDSERARAKLDAEQRVLRILGIIADTLDWRALQAAMLREQVAGFYDPRAKSLFLEDEPDDPTLAIVIPHELTHALQDQYEDVDALAHPSNDDDRALAARAALEGQATLVAFQVALGLDGDLPGSEDAIRESVQEEAHDSPVLASAPLFAQRLEVFPYVDGLAFVQRRQRSHPDAHAFGAELPVSTAQILHPEKYEGTWRAPPAITLTAAPGAEVLYENDFGELGTRALLEQALHDRKRATRAADGWSADRFALLSTPQGDAFAWVTVCETGADAAELADAVRRLAARRWPRTSVAREGVRTRAVSARRTITVWNGAIDAHAVVIYVDAPTGAPEPLDRGGVTVRDARAVLP